MTRPLLGLLLLVDACGSPLSSPPAETHEEKSAVESELVAIEFSGSKRSLDRLAAESARLGWRVDRRDTRSLRILPPANDEFSQFKALIDRIEQLGLTDIGLRLIGPNGPVGPEG